MKPSITVGVLEFGTVVAYVLIFTLLWRWGAAAAGDTPLGRAMAGIYS